MALSNYPKFKAFDSSGNLLSGGLLYTYDAGTSTPKAAYQDKDYLTPHTNPIVLDANGEALIYTSGSYKLVLKTSAGITLWTIDNYLSANGLLGDLVPEADKFPYFTSGTAAALTAITALGRSLLARATAQLMRNDLDAPSRALSEISGTAAGTDTYTLNLDPAIAAYTTGAYYFITFTNANTAVAPTLNLNSLGAKIIKLLGGGALIAGSIIAGHKALLKYDGTDMILMNDYSIDAGASVGSRRTIGTGALQACAGNDGRLLSRCELFTSGGTWTRPSGVTTARVVAVGGGGGGGGAGPFSGGGGGGRGGIIEKVCTITGDVTVTIGSGGAGGAAMTVGSTGGTSSFGSLCAGTGGAGGAGAGGGAGAPGSGGAAGSYSGSGSSVSAYLEPGYIGTDPTGGTGGGNYWGTIYGYGGNGGTAVNGSGNAGAAGYVLVMW